MGLRNLALTLFIIGQITLLQAAVRLPAVLSDHMVLQRNSAVKLWGWSGPSEDIKITATWDNHTYDIKADRNARWEITIPTPQAGGPYEITFEASNRIVLSDILIGEVWVCSGQSNMEWSAVNGFDNDQAEVAQADHPQIRFFQIPKTTSEYPQDNCEAEWEVCTPASFRDFSAVAYFFGRHLQQELEGVPIGLIQSAWGGTAAEVWTPEPVITANPQFNAWDEVLSTSDWWPRRPGVVYNAMIHPITNFRVAGTIWYQGESNTANPFVYRDLFPAMIQSWREAWDFPMPFYFVQIAPFRYGEPLVGALVREAQLQTLQKVPNTGMAVVHDIGNINDIHPRNKQDVGTRLALWALARTYGKPGVVYSGPLYKSHKIENGRVRINFQHAEDGLLAKDGPLNGFTIAGEDQIFFPAKATIEGGEVVVESSYVLQPVAVRYGFSNTTNPNLFNQHGLPASTFRTDDWPIVIRDIEVDVAYKHDAQAYLVTLSADADIDEIKYTTNGDPPGLFGLTYRQPFYVDGDCTIKALAFVGGKASDAISSRELKLNKATFKPIVQMSRYAPERSAGGDDALIDGLTGSKSYGDGRWQGYLGNNMSMTLDFGERIEIETIQLQALKDQKAGIFLPNKVLFEISNDGDRWLEVYRKPLFHAKEDDVEIVDYNFRFNRPRKTRFVRVSADNVGTCPPWHSNSGEPAWLMLDELSIN